MTQEEQQSIINAVLSAIRTNSRTIAQLSAVDSLNDDDSFEVSGGKRVTYGVLKSLIASFSSADTDTLLAAINRKELASATITTNETTATLTITNVGGTSISCNVPVATKDNAGIITATQAVMIQSAYDNSRTALNDADEAKTLARSINNKLGIAGGIATLDASGKLNTEQLPDGIATDSDLSAVESKADAAQETADEAKELAETADGKADTNAGNIAALQGSVATLRTLVSEGYAFMGVATPTTDPGTPKGKVFYLALTDGDYPNFPTNMAVLDPETGDSHEVPFTLADDEVAILRYTPNDGEQAQVTEWSKITLNIAKRSVVQALSATVGDNASAIDDVVTRLAMMNSFNGNEVTGHSGDTLTLAQFVALTAGDIYAGLHKIAVIVSLNTPDGLKAYQWKGNSWSNTEDWKEFGGSAAVGNCYNVTNEVPVSGYYNLERAIAATFAKGLAGVGMQITFAIDDGIWKTYQYVGRDTTEANFNNLTNWVDMAGMSAGSEPTININDLCGSPSGSEFYDLTSAINALVDYGNSTGINYKKAGLVITYMSGENEWTTKQFQGEVDNFGVARFWNDFGSSGSQIITSDTPAQNGTDAFSTGGAYEHVPANLVKDTETEGVVKLQLVNAAGDAVGDEIQFSVGTGSGSGGEGGTVVAIALQRNPIYGKAGGTFVANAAIMSVTTVGSQESSNPISLIEVIDRTTKRVLKTIVPSDAQSSATMQDYKFALDISDIFTTAGQYSLQLRATDDTGNTATKNLSVVAVDVTCVSTQTLNYTDDTALEVGGRSKRISLFSFPNNASAQGIKAIVEMYLNGEWTTILEKVITDTYAQYVNIDPSGLAHGAYPIRVHGEDVASGVVGNYLHSAVMVVQKDDSHADYSKPIIVARWSDTTNGKMQLYNTVNFDLAAYQSGDAVPTVTVEITNETTGATELLASQSMSRSNVYPISKRLTGYNEGDTLTFVARTGNITMPEPLQIEIDGTLIPISESDGAVFKIDMAGRSNADSDKSISVEDSDGGQVNINVTGSNYRTTGFIKDSFGTEDYGTTKDTGRMALRIAENVTAECDYAPFAKSSAERNGAALSLTVMTKNVADPDAHLIECMSGSLGFVLTGEKLILTTSGSLDGRNNSTVAIVPHVNGIVRRYDIVIEPAENAPYAGIGVIKIFCNGDEVGCASYSAGELAVHNDTIHFDGTEGDIYLYNITAWNTYYNFMQAFENYLVGLTDTSAMISEYETNQVMASQTAEGTTKDRPDMQKCLDAGLMVVALTKNPDTADEPGNYPDYLEGLDGDKKTQKELDWYCYFPDRPWQDCRIVSNTTTNQGTTSSWRKIKNKKGKSKGKKIELLHTRQQIATMYSGDATILALYDECAAQAAKSRIQIAAGGRFTNIECIKVDYSDSSGAHNGAMMELMNDTQILLGEEYRTPAQNANEDGIEIHTSIDSVPCALFRTDSNMTHNDACDPKKAYFHAKANFNADKGDASFFGFEGVKGYNAKCLNYGDFVELVAADGQTLSDFKAEVLGNASSLLAGNIYVLSEYCGSGRVVFENDGSGSMQIVAGVEQPTEIDKTLAEIQADDTANYDWGKVYLTSDGQYVQYKGGTWKETTGSMTYNATTKKWSVEGRFVNPVECYEYLKYDSLCWGQDVNSVADMMRIDPATGFPVWMSYYESRYPDNKELNALYEQGKKVPYNLYRWLRWNQDCNHNLTAADGDITINGSTVQGTPENRLLKFRRELHKYANPHSIGCYTVASDYKAAVDQRSKNAMITFYLDIANIIRAYLNHWYDGDCVDGSDNDCGITIPWDMDAVTSHLYQGWDGVIFHQSYAAFAKRATDSNGNVTDDGGVWVDDNGATTINLHQIAEAMRDLEKDGRGVFSPDGCYYYWITKRIAKWAKVISSFDGERKYIQNSTQASNYFYALHGLRLEDLPDYQRKRFAFRDGFYQVGDLYKNPFKARMMGDIAVTIEAAQDGFFGLGEDRADTCADSCYLHAGESYTLRAKPAQEGGKMIYIFGADKLSKLDISACACKYEGFDINACTMLTELIIGGENYSSEYLSSAITQLDLPSMPFLRRIDVRNTAIQTVTATGCPRLQELLAGGSALTAFTPAETAPLTTVELPATVTLLQFLYIASLVYPNGGLTIGGLTAVERLRIEGSPNIDASLLLKSILTAQSAVNKLARVRLAGQTITGDGTDLAMLVTRNVAGYNADGNGIAKPAIEATYELTRLYESYEIEAWEAAIYGLTVLTVIDAYINLINDLNGEDYGGDAEVETVTLDNVDALALTYYNGEDYDDYLSEFATANADINQIVTS